MYFPVYTTLHYKACTRYFPVVLRSTTSYYKACTKVLPNTTSYYKACTRYFPVLLRTTKLAQSTSQYFFVHDFVLQSLHKSTCSTTSDYKACTKVLPSTTSYYKACTKHFPVLLRTKKLAQSTSNHCLASHTTTAPSTAEINKMDAAITLQTATQDRQITKPIGTAQSTISLPDLKVHFTMAGAKRTQNRHSRVAQTRFPTSTPGAILCKKYKVSCNS